MHWIEWIYLLPGLMERKKQHLWESIHLSRSINLVGTFYGSLHWVLQLAPGVGGYLLPVFSFGYFHIPNELAIVIVKLESISGIFKIMFK